MEYLCILGGYYFFFYWLGGGSFHFHVITIQNLISTEIETFFIVLRFTFFCFLCAYIGPAKEGKWSNSFGPTFPKSRKHCWEGI